MSDQEYMGCGFIIYKQEEKIVRINHFSSKKNDVIFQIFGSDEGLRRIGHAALKTESHLKLR